MHTATEILVLLVFCSFCNALSLPDPIEVLELYRYPGEVHQVTTEDGYILRLVRIVPEKPAFGQQNLPVILLNHGLLGSSGYFMDFKRSLTIGYILSDAGYDVWMMNGRGNGYSSEHTTLDQNENPKEFFNFTFHEIGYYDIPATIDYILDITKEKNLHYLGHSQGGTAFYIAASTRPEYNKKIKLAIMLAATASFKNTPVSHATFLAGHIKTIQKIMTFFGLHQLPLIDSMRILFNFLCSYSIMERPCLELVWFVAGFEDRAQFDTARFQSLFNFFPARCSMKQFYHYAQLVQQERFGPYDYGVEGNRKQYGREVPPDYDFSKVTAPVAIYCSKNDQLYSLKDCELTSSFLPNLAFKKVIKQDKFNHIDYIMAKDAKTIVFNEMLVLMEKYN